MKSIDTDICIIGGGSGGLSLASGAVQMGANVVLFEGAEMGGDCLNSGCVPSKALLAAGKAAHHAHGNKAMGVTGAAPKVDFKKVKEHVQEVIDTIAPHDSVKRFTGLGVNVIEERAAFAGPRLVRSKNFEVRAKYFVVATGSRAMVPPIEGLDKVPFHTNETIFKDTTKPEHLVVIGGGPIGIEMAQAHARLGCKVTVVEAFAILGRDDHDLAAILKERLADEGITLIERVGVSSVSGTKGTAKKPGKVTVKLADGKSISASHILVAAGRRPNIDDLGLEEAGIKTQRSGIVTDKRLRSSDKRVFAIGDVAGRAQFTHIAGYHASIVIKNILFKIPSKVDDSMIPWVTYTDPELAHVGLTQGQAAEMWGAKNIRTQSVDLSGIDRAVAERRTEGKVKVVKHKNGNVLGATILAPHAGEMILAWAHVIASRRKIGSMATVIAPYPTYGDASKRAAGQFFTESLFSDRTKSIVRKLLKI